MIGFWTSFIIAVLATWRLMRLIAREDGPWNVITKLRVKFGDIGGGELGELMDCFFCLSMWLSLPTLFLFDATWWQLIFVWLAVSAGASLITIATKEHEE